VKTRWQKSTVSSKGHRVNLQNPHWKNKVYGTTKRHFISSPYLNWFFSQKTNITRSKIKLLQLCFIRTERVMYVNRRFIFWRCGPMRAMASTLMRFLDHTQRRTTVGRTPLYEWPARRRDHYLTTHNIHKRHPCPQRDSNPQSQ